MWMKFKCWWFGHKTMVQSFTGNHITVPDRLCGGEMNAATYVWKREKYCVRCGVEVWHVRDNVRVDKKDGEWRNHMGEWNPNEDRGQKRGKI